MTRTLLIAGAIVLAGFLIGGRFSGLTADGSIYYADRFTGTVYVCSLMSPCRPL